VAVALPRSAATVVAFLAVLQAGAVYMPLDCSYPAARLQMLLDDARPALLIDGPATAALRCARLPDAARRRWPPAQPPEPFTFLPTCLPPEVSPPTWPTSSTPPAPPARPSPWASRMPLPLNLAFARRSHAPVGPGDRILAGVSVGFDVSIEQLLLPLLHGAAVVIAPALGQLDARAFWSLLNEHQRLRRQLRAQLHRRGL
jgi:non-ribosomal peptide synthetase component F